MDKKYLYIGLIAGIAVIGGALWISMSSTGTPKSEVVPIQATQAVELKDGDAYTLTASYIAKEITGTEQKMLS